MSDTAKPLPSVTKSQNFVMPTDAPRFATRILATANRDSVTFSFGVEDPTNASQVYVHTRIAMTMSAYKSFKEMLDRMNTDMELKKAMHGIQYSQIPSDARGCLITGPNPSDNTTRWIWSLWVIVRF